MVDLNSIELFLESLRSVSTISRELLGLEKSKDISEKNWRIERQNYRGLKICFICPRNTRATY